MRVPYVRTGYEAVFPIRAGDKFVQVAIEDGVVEDVTDKEVIVKYKSTTKSYKLYSWTSKEESQSCFTHVLVTNLKKGDKVTKDDTIVYDSSFFQPDIFNKRRVLYKQGTYANVAVVEDSETYEDSGSISRKLSNKLSIKATKVTSIIFNVKDNIHNLVKIGTDVNPGDPLFTFVINEALNNDIDSEILSILQDIKQSSPKAKIKGKINNIVFYYNSDFENLSDSLKTYVKESDKRLKHVTGHTGRVDASYSHEGKSLLEGEIIVKIYTIADDYMGVGDKAIFGNQLKFTVGDVFEDIRTEDGTEVDARFGYISIQNRIVNSPNLIGTTSTLIKLIQEQAVKMYFE